MRTSLIFLLDSMSMYGPREEKGQLVFNEIKSRKNSKSSKGLRILAPFLTGPFPYGSFSLKLVVSTVIGWFAHDLSFLFVFLFEENSDKQ